MNNNYLATLLVQKLQSFCTWTETAHFWAVMYFVLGLGVALPAVIASIWQLSGSRLTRVRPEEQTAFGLYFVRITIWVIIIQIIISPVAFMRFDALDRAFQLVNNQSTNGAVVHILFFSTWIITGLLSILITKFMIYKTLGVWIVDSGESKLEDDVSFITLTHAYSQHTDAFTHLKEARAAGATRLYITFYRSRWVLLTTMFITSFLLYTYYTTLMLGDWDHITAEVVKYLYGDDVIQLQKNSEDGGRFAPWVSKVMYLQVVLYLLMILMC